MAAGGAPRCTAAVLPEPAALPAAAAPQPAAAAGGSAPRSAVRRAAAASARPAAAAPSIPAGVGGESAIGPQMLPMNDQLRELRAIVRDKTEPGGHGAALSPSPRVPCG